MFKFAKNDDHVACTESSLITIGIEEGFLTVVISDLSESPSNPRWSIPSLLMVPMVSAAIAIAVNSYACVIRVMPPGHLLS